MKFDPYEILGVPRNADASTIKSAHRQRVKQTHPDAGGDASVFADVTRAFDILTDQAKRQRFDNTGDADELKPDITDAAAWGIVATVVKMILQGDQEPAPADDLLATIRAAVEHGIGQIQNMLAVHDRIQRRSKLFASRFRGRTADHVMLGNLVVGAATEAAELRQKAETTLLRHRRALDLLADYEFMVDQPSPISMLYRIGLRAVTETASG